MRWGTFYLLALLAGLSTSALQADVTGSILGTVRDTSNSVVVGATISATEITTNFTRTAVSSSTGEYRLLALPAGQYRVTATAAGFEQFITTGITVDVNDQLRV